MPPTSAPVRERQPEDLDPRMLHQFRRLKQTLDEGAIELVMTVASEWVVRHPEVPSFRRLLREAQRRNNHQPDRHRGISSSLLRRLLCMTLKNEKSPLITLIKCEKILASDPMNITANQTLAEAASALGWSETAALGWQTLLLNPHVQACHILAFGQHLLDHQDNQEVLRLCDTYIQVFPNAPLLLGLRDQAAIRLSIHSAG